MLLYYPLSNLLTLFANTLQNPQDPEARSDLKLMDIVISLLSEPAFHVNVPTANAARLFVELGNITRKLVEKTNSNTTKPTKRARDEYDHKQDKYQLSAQEPHVPETLAELENSGQQSGFMVSTGPSTSKPLPISTVTTVHQLTLNVHSATYCQGHKQWRQFNSLVPRFAFLWRYPPAGHQQYTASFVPNRYNRGRSIYHV